MSDWYAVLKEAVQELLVHEAQHEGDPQRRVRLRGLAVRLEAVEPPIPSVRDPEMSMANMRFLAGQQGEPGYPDGTCLVEKETGTEYEIARQPTAEDPFYQLKRQDGCIIAPDYEELRRDFRRVTAKEA